MPPAARIGDNHTCPLVDPGPKPRVGGPAARLGDATAHGGIVAAGSDNVIIN